MVQSHFLNSPKNIGEIKRFPHSIGFSNASEPVPRVVVLRAGDSHICLLERPAGTQASPRTAEMRHNERHWTPVHLDIHVDDFEGALAWSLAAVSTLALGFKLVPAEEALRRARRCALIGLVAGLPLATS